MLQIK